MKNKFDVTIYEGNECSSEQSKADLGVVFEGLALNAKQNGVKPYQREGFVIIFKNDEGNVIGGGSVGIAWNKLELEAGWVHPDYRKQEIGTEFVSQAEDIGRKKGANISFVWTTSCEAPDFYEKLGYERVVELPDVPAGKKMYGYLKKLTR